MYLKQLEDTSFHAYQLGCFWPQVPENPTQKSLNTKVIYYFM